MHCVVNIYFIPVYRYTPTPHTLHFSTIPVYTLFMTARWTQHRKKDTSNRSIIATSRLSLNKMLYPLLILFSHIIATVQSFYPKNTYSTQKTRLNLTQNKGANFKYFRDLDDRVRRISNQESEYLSSFWNENLKCFQIYPNIKTPRISVISTCLSIEAILANPTGWDGKCRWETTSDSQISLKSAVDALKGAPWTLDAFQTPVLVFLLPLIISKNRTHLNSSSTLYYIIFRSVLCVKQSLLHLVTKNLNRLYMCYWSR